MKQEMTWNGRKFVNLLLVSLVSRLSYPEKPNISPTAWAVLLLRHVCFPRTSPQHPWSWWNHRWPQHSLPQHLVCWVCHAPAGWQVRTSEDTLLLQDLWKWNASLHQCIFCSIYVVNSKLEMSSGHRYFYSTVVATWLNLETTVWFNSSLIWGLCFITPLAAHVLEHDTQANAWRSKPALLLYCQKKSMAEEALLECYSKTQQVPLFCYLSTVSAWICWSFISQTAGGHT